MSKDDKSIFVVMPAYQAAETLAGVFARIPASLLGERGLRFIVVNDGSTDDTRQVVQQLMERVDNIQAANHQENLGYAAAQKTGFKMALEQGADIVVLLHSDGQYAPELLPVLLKPLQDEQADVVQGSRILGGKAIEGGMPLYKYLANRVLSTLENIVTGLHLAEYHSGYMLYSRKALEAIPFEKLGNTFHFDGEMLIMAAKRGMRVKEIGIPTRYGTERSYLRPIPYGLNVLRILFNVLRGKYDRL